MRTSASSFVCADDPTDDEIMEIEARVEANVCLHQQHPRGYAAEHVAAMQAVA